MSTAPAKYFSSAQLLQLARDGVSASERDTLQALAAIVFSALALEAVVNEMLERIRMPFARGAHIEVARLAAIAEAAGLYDRTASIAMKVRLMAAVLGGDMRATGQQPYQDFDLLIQLRNFVVHSRPELLQQDASGNWTPQKILQRLAARKVIDVPSTTFGTTVVNCLQDPRVARWAYGTMVDTIAILLEAFPRDFRAAQQWDQCYGRANLAI